MYRLTFFLFFWEVGAALHHASWRSSSRSRIAFDDINSTASRRYFTYRDFQAGTVNTRVIGTSCCTPALPTRLMRTCIANTPGAHLHRQHA
jgi:hypothetical protein